MVELDDAGCRPLWRRKSERFQKHVLADAACPCSIGRADTSPETAAIELAKGEAADDKNSLWAGLAAAHAAAARNDRLDRAFARKRREPSDDGDHLFAEVDHGPNSVEGSSSEGECLDPNRAISCVWKN